MSTNRYARFLHELVHIDPNEDWCDGEEIDNHLTPPPSPDARYEELDQESLQLVCRGQYANNLSRTMSDMLLITLIHTGNAPTGQFQNPFSALADPDVQVIWVFCSSKQQVQRVDYDPARRIEELARQIILNFYHPGYSNGATTTICSDNFNAQLEARRNAFLTRADELAAEMRAYHSEGLCFNCSSSQNRYVEPEHDKTGGNEVGK